MFQEAPEGSWNILRDGPAGLLRMRAGAMGQALGIRAEAVCQTLRMRA
jgi:hypothetical protein